MRKDTYRVESESVQGVGSWVELTALTRREWKELLAAEGERTEAIVTEAVVAWNWTGDDGHELPIPPDADALNMLEFSFLARSLLTPPAATKN
jgi:hypothetical protein